jgi:hypothetical protein
MLAWPGKVKPVCSVARRQGRDVTSVDVRCGGDRESDSNSNGSNNYESKVSVIVGLSARDARYVCWKKGASWTWREW